MAPPTPPSNALPFLQQAAKGTGLPLSVVEAQNFTESDYGRNQGPSSAGAEGPWQFLPSTFTGLGFAAGQETNWSVSTQAYIKYMDQLIKQEGGSVFKALEAYNAGPGNLGGGAGYANSILSMAGQSTSIKAGQPGTTQPVQATLTGFPNPLNIPGDLGNAVSSAITGAFSSLIQGIFNALGVPSLKDLFQRLALILLGVALVLVGIRIISQGSSSKSQPFTVNVNEESNETTGTTRTTREVKHPLGKTKKTTVTGSGGSAISTAGKTGATDAIEAAAVA